MPPPLTPLTTTYHSKGMECWDFAVTSLVVGDRVVGIPLKLLQILSSWEVLGKSTTCLTPLPLYKLMS